MVILLCNHPPWPTRPSTISGRDQLKMGFTFSAENENGAENEISF